MTTSDKALAWWAALSPEEIEDLYTISTIGETLPTIDPEIFIEGVENGILKGYDAPLAKRNYQVAEYLWQELLGVVMINESGRTLSSEEIKSCRDALEKQRPIKQ